MFLVVLLFALFASLFTLQKFTLSISSPLFLVGARMTFAGVILLSYAIYKNPNIKIKPMHWLYLFALAFLHIYLTNIAEIWALNHMVSCKSCLIYSLSPFLAALIAFFFLKETLNLKKWTGLITGFLGLLPLIYLQTAEELNNGYFFIFSLPEIVMLIAVISSVLGWILLKKLVYDMQYTPIFANGFAMLVGGSMALVHSYIAREWQPSPVLPEQTHIFILSSLFMCLISNIICYNLYGYLLKKYTATFMSFAGLITPIFTSIYGVIFLNESIKWNYFFLSLSLFLIGLSIFYFEEIRKEGFTNKNSATVAAL